MHWIVFLRALHMAMVRERMHFNPITKSVGPWIDLGALHRGYGRNLPFPQDIPVPMAASYQHQQQHQQHQQWQHQQQQQQQQHNRPPMPNQMPPQQQQPPAGATGPAPETNLLGNKYAQQASGDEHMAQLKHAIVTWATAAPVHQNLRSIDQLLGTMQQTFPPAFGVSSHAYFQKFKPFASDALQGRDRDVLKRGVYWSNEP